MTSSTRHKDLPAITHDPTGETYRDGLPTFYWNRAPEHLMTYRQLSRHGLRPGGQAPCARIRKGWLIGYLYDSTVAKPKRRLTEAMMAAVWTAVRSKYHCSTCGRTDLGYIPQQGPPADGRCWTCMGLPEPDQEPPAMTCPGCGDETEIDCPACQGDGGWEGSCGMCEGCGVVTCTMCQGI